MNHKTFLQRAIVIVIGTLIVWSVVNVSTYAYTYHASWVVGTLGLAVGAANAISVYAYVIAAGNAVRKPALVGILLFGGASGTLQMLLYIHDGAPLAAAIPFGWIGPVAEGVLSWLHAALSEEGAGLVKRKVQASASKSAQPAPDLQEPAPTALAVQARNMKENKMKIADIAAQLQCSERTVYNLLKSMKPIVPATNGHKEIAQ